MRQWTTEKPTEPGWYWVKERDIWRSIAFIGAVQFEERTVITESGREVPFDDVLVWSGPIPEPTEPE